MIRYMSDQIKLSPFNRILAYKLSDLQLSLPKNLVLVKCSQSLLDALQAMHMNRVSSVAVVDNSGKLLGNISAADVKYIMRNLRYGILFDTCAHFINKVKTTKMLENAGKDSVPVIQCSPHIVLVQLIKVLLVMQVHRIWITEQSPDLPTFQEPISVISLTDIFRALVPSTNRD
ncbi:cell separation during budding [Coelomomyces lativittatus]|nr:cell separation during budding [Coelomomyces lativittatus]